MKKLIAFLTVCTMMTCAFGSCGKDKDSESSAESSISATKNEEVSETETTIEPTTETVTETTTSATTETTTETTATETTTQTTTETTTETVTTSTSAESDTQSETVETIAQSDVSEESIIGKWFTKADDDTFIGFDFKENGNIDMFVDISELSHFTTDGKLVMQDVTFNSQFDGTILSVNVNGTDLMTMSKYDGGTDTLNGTYNLLSGSFYDNMIQSGQSNISIIISGEKMYLDYPDMLTYKIDGNNISMSGFKNLDADIDSVVSTYEIQGNQVTFSSFGDDKNLTMQRFEI